MLCDQKDPKELQNSSFSYKNTSEGPWSYHLSCCPLVGPREEMELNRLLHSPSLVALGLSGEYETWPPIGWHCHFVIGQSKYNVVIASVVISWNRWEFPPYFQRALTVPLRSPNGRQMPAVRAVQGGCERVWELKDTRLIEPKTKQ